MIDVIQWLMEMKQMFWNWNIHLVGSFSRRARFHPACLQEKKKSFEKADGMTSWHGKAIAPDRIRFQPY